MAITTYEIFGSPRGVDGLNYKSTAERQFIATGSNDIDAVQAHLDTTDNVKDDYRGLAYDSIDYEPVGFELWLCRVKYVDKQKKEDDHQLLTATYSVRFNTTGGTTKLYQAFATTAHPKSGETAPDFKNAIAVDMKTKEVRGVDVVIPALNFTITYKQPAANITFAYMRTLARMTGRTNQQAFHGFQAGEVLFLGADGGQQSDADPEVSYHFTASQDITGLAIGEITGIDKPGHDYIWPIYEQTEDSNAKALVPRPSAVYVSRVYNRDDFALFGIGGT